MQNINPFLANVPILYPLKTPENQRFPDVWGYKMGTLARNRLYDMLHYILKIAFSNDAFPVISHCLYKVNI